MKRAWIMLTVAIVSEVCGTTALKLSAGFTEILPTIVVAVAYTIAFTMLTFVLRDMSLGLAYGVGAGLERF